MATKIGSKKYKVPAPPKTEPQQPPVTVRGLPDVEFENGQLTFKGAKNIFDWIQSLVPELKLTFEYVDKVIFHPGVTYWAKIATNKAFPGLMLNTIAVSIAERNPYIEQSVRVELERYS